ncbi:MAG: bifunctional ligase/repressor BirA [Melioribacteraceae bacterium]|nr:MAG: bifunctional ligase/repressor BirA [Melioribacteraceae bacterium]
MKTIDKKSFNHEDFYLKLDTDVIGRNFVEVDEIDSTNAFLLKTNDYNQNGTVILADYQTAGRGRREREWISAKELNLTFSVLLNNNLDKVNVNLLILGSALAVAQALENLYQLNVELKWPNDVLVKRKKICGILLESSAKGSKLDKLVIGFGINVNQVNFPGKYNITPTSVKSEFKSTVERERLLAEILNNLEAIFIELVKTPEKVLDAWRDRCKMLGEKIKIEDDGKARFGIFDNIDQNGFILLKTPEGREKVHIGDVSIR